MYLEPLDPAAQEIEEQLAIYDDSDVLGVNSGNGLSRFENKSTTTTKVIFF